MSPSNFQKVKTFHQRFDPSASAYKDLLGRRIEFLLEEVREAEEAAHDTKNDPSRTNKAHLIKELCDVLFVTYGFLELLGVDANAAFDEVFESNMSKTPNASGKAIKGPDYKVAEMERFV